MPLSAVSTFTDPICIFRGSETCRLRGSITKRGEFRAESTRIDLHRLWMHRFDESLPRIMRITPSGKRSLILFATDPYQPEMQVSGIKASQDQIAMFGLDWPYYLRSSAACGWGTMSLTPEDLAAASEAIIGRPLTPPSFPRWTSPPAPVASRLLQLHEAAGHLAKTAPDILAKPEVARAIEEALVEAMILCLTEGHLDDVRNVHRHRARVMRRLEEVLTATPDRPLYMPQLCATVGASYTTLRDCCQDFLGMSPETLSVAAAHAPGAPGFAERGCGEDDRDRDRDRLWLLGIGPLCGRLPVTIRRSALGGTASTPRSLKTGGNRRAGMEIC